MGIEGPAREERPDPLGHRGGDTLRGAGGHVETVGEIVVGQAEGRAVAQVDIKAAVPGAATGRAERRTEWSLYPVKRGIAQPVRKSRISGSAVRSWTKKA